ncbi:MAG: oxidoreductase-like domain-containing protein [Hyphomonadaceae bacterium]
MSSPSAFPRPPNKPDDESCCHRGCCPCIFDYYWDALAKWEEMVRELGGDPVAELALLGRSR